MSSPIQRLRYFDHQLLGVQEFADEQSYHMDMRRLHNRLLHTWGIADGLEVHYSAASQRLTVEEGIAIDAQGREIVLQQQRDADLAAYDGQTVWITIAYGENEAAPLTDGQATEYGRWEETPRIDVSLAPPADSGRQLVLARVQVSTRGESKVDDGEGAVRRRQAGSKAGDLEVRALTLSGTVDPDQWPRLQLAGPRAASLNAAFSVDGVLSATGDLEVQGSGTVTQSLGVGGKPQARLHVQHQPQDATGNAVVVGPAEGTSLRLGYNLGYSWIQARDGGLRINELGGDVLLAAAGLANVGIGTNQPLQRLHVVADDAVGLFESRGSTGAISIATRDGQASWVGIANRPGGRLALWTQAGDDVVNVTRDGRVGMGTENPTHRFHVRADDPVALFESIGSQAYLRIATREGMESRVEVANRPGGRLALWTAGGGDGLSLTRDGMVGIGTDRPTARLHVAGDLVVDGEIRSKAGTPVAGGGQPGWAPSPWQPVTAGLGFAGSVGVGTLTPEARLQVVNSPQDSNGNTLIVGPTNAPNLRLGYNTDYSWIQSHGSRPLRINELGNDVVLNAGGGNVGIGTAAPAGKLHVAGDLVVDGQIRTAQGPLVPGGATGGAAPIAPLRLVAPDAPLTLEAPGDGVRMIFVQQAGQSAWDMGLGGGRTPGARDFWVGDGRRVHFSIADGTGNTGIGTTSPQGKLHVAGDLVVDGQIRAAGGTVGGAPNAGASSPWRTGANGAAVTSTAVGVNTDDPSHPLHVRGDGAVGLFESTSAQAVVRVSANDGFDNRVELANRGGGRLALWVHDAGDALTILKDGKVGIGTPAPQTPLHVKGDLLVEGTIRTPQGTLSPGGGGGGGTSPWGLAPSGISYVGGQVGVGVDQPNHVLHVRTEGAVGLFESTSNNAFLRVATNDGINNRVELCNRGGGRLALWVAGASDAFNITRDGRVGINTTTPEAKLQVVDAPQGPGGNTLILGPTDGSNLRLGYDTEYSWIQSHGSKPLRINELGNDVVLSPGGKANVGIGTASPTARLHVVGDLLVEGTIRTPAGPVGAAGAPAASPWTPVNGGISFKGGRVGIGTDSLPQQLNVTEGIGFANQNATDKRLWSPQDGLLRWQTHNSAGQHAFEVGHQGDAATVRLDTAGPSWLAGGSLGVGTAAPEAKLQVINGPQDSGGNTLILGPTNAANLRLGYNAEYSWIQSHGSKPLRINELGNDVLMALGGSNVGVGLAPQAKLHTSGQITAGPYAWPNAAGRVEATGPAGELSFARRDLTAPRSQAGDRYVWYNQDGTARLWTEGVGNIVAIDAAGNLEVNNLRIRSGAKPGFVYDHFVNMAGDSVEQGDVVIIGDAEVSHYWATGNTIPIPEVDLCATAYDTRVCGIVDTVTHSDELPHAEAQKRRGRRKPVADDGTHPLQSLAADEDADDSVGEGQLGKMVTLGAYAFCKVDADIAPIKAGDLLTTSPTKGHAQKAVDRAQSPGAIIGKALGSLAKGRGKIPVMVLMQ